VVASESTTGRAVGAPSPGALSVAAQSMAAQSVAAQSMAAQSVAVASDPDHGADGTHSTHTGDVG